MFPGVGGVQRKARLFGSKGLGKSQVITIRIRVVFGVAE